jgi:structure-specific endonuclease subunit SLX1
LSLHIPVDERISVFTQRKRNGQPKRPRANITSILSNLHLLLRVPSFKRWPLSLHFFDKGVYDKWKDWIGGVDEPLRRNLVVKTDFAPEDTSRPAASQGEERPWGVHALPLDYTPLKEYAEKASNIFAFEREGSCVHCKAGMPAGEGLYAVCPNLDCEAVGHLRCWGRHILEVEGGDEEGIVPLQGKCPSCKGDLRWADMMKELTLRVRDPKEVDKLLLRKRRRAKKA